MSGKRPQKLCNFHVNCHWCVLWNASLFVLSLVVIHSIALHLCWAHECRTKLGSRAPTWQPATADACTSVVDTSKARNGLVDVTLRQLTLHLTHILPTAHNLQIYECMCVAINPNCCICLEILFRTALQAPVRRLPP